jgi:hypothetical protein
MNKCRRINSYKGCMTRLISILLQNQSKISGTPTTGPRYVTGASQASAPHLPSKLIVPALEWTEDRLELTTACEPIHEMLL